jgi:hypothetical protein
MERNSYTSFEVELVDQIQNNGNSGQFQFNIKTLNNILDDCSL